MNLIAAVDSNWGIGNKGNLLFHIPEDMRFFRSTTMGKVVVMGMKTLESFRDKKPLIGRTNIVLTRQEITLPGFTVCHNIWETLGILSAYDTNDVFIIGGGQVYGQFLPFCNRALITQVDKKSEADVFFPNLDQEPGWVLSRTSDLHIYNGLGFMFSEYKNVPGFL